MSPRLAFAGVSRSFGALRALDRVDLSVEAGEIHALLGENGAGKTTLVRMALGELAPDQGRLEVDGAAVSLHRPAQAEALGIGMVHQHFTLAEALTVADNLTLGRRGFWWSPGARRREAQRILQRTGMTLPVARPVRDLSVGEKQRLEIAKALERGRRVLILDEPSAVLTEPEVEDLFERLRALRAQGRALLWITHKLPEVMALADRVTVLRHGRVVWQGAVADTGPGKLARAIAGQDPGPPPPPPEPHAASATAPVLRAVGLRAPGLGPVDLEVRRGEILGVAGVAGNGQTPLVEVVAGLRAATAGALQREGRPALLTGDRHGTGLALDLAAAENALLRRGLLPGPWFRRRTLEQRAARTLAGHDVRLQDLWQPVRTLSGGNQQKLLCARELHLQPALILAENPTRGLDLAATRAVRARLRRAAREGAGVLLASTDLDEVLELADRVLVAHRGRLEPGVRDRAALTALVAGVEWQP